jgi:NADP-dependent 3-hydroxy acid dehydrogenase YdfG
MSSVKGKLFAITGAASGIGLATARVLAEQGAVLTLADTDWDRLLELQQELSVNKGVQVLSRNVDVRDCYGVNEWIQAAVKEFDRPLDGQ